MEGYTHIIFLRGSFVRSFIPCDSYNIFSKFSWIGLGSQSWAGSFELLFVQCFHWWGHYHMQTHSWLGWFKLLFWLVMPDFCCISGYAVKLLSFNLIVTSLFPSLNAGKWRGLWPNKFIVLKQNYFFFGLYLFLEVFKYVDHDFFLCCF